MAELIAYAKANPGKLNYSTGGAGTLPHLTAELFKKLSGTQIIVHVPYKGGGPALADVVAGQVQMTFDTVGTSLGFIRSGQLARAGAGRARAHRAIARGADDAGARLPDHHHRRLDRAAGAEGDAARDRRPPQRGLQRSAEDAGR